MNQLQLPLTMTEQSEEEWLEQERLRAFHYFCDVHND